jgi:hypothetical protein
MPMITNPNLENKAMTNFMHCVFLSKNFNVFLFLIYFIGKKLTTEIKHKNKEIN